MSSATVNLEKFNIGLVRDGTVVLLPHDPRWLEAACNEIERVRQKVVLPQTSFHHIGSTSIPGICAKPILDILIIVPEIEEIDQFQKEFENLGYEYKGEYGIAGRRYCVLYDDEKTKGFVHIHAFEAGSLEAKSHLIFRDYLRSHPDKAAEYQDLKRKLLADPEKKRSQYTENKAPFISDILKEALDWTKK